MTTCGISDPIGQWAISLEGYDNLMSFGEMVPDDVDELSKNMANKSRAQTGKWNLPTRNKINLKAMVWWIRDLTTRGQPLPDIGFTAADLAKARHELQNKSESETAKNPVELPGKFMARNWVSWWESVKNYLKGQPGRAGKPLIYVVRNRQPPPQFIDEIEREAYQMPLNGDNYAADNNTVYRILKSLTLDTQAIAWVQPHDRSSDGRAAALALMDQYDGPAEELNRYNAAKQEIKEAEYRGNEAIYPFTKYAAMLQKAFTTMEQSNRAKPPRDQVEELLTGMKISTNNPYFTQYTNIKMQAQRDHSNDFAAAITFIASEISNNIPVSSQDNKGTKRYRAVSNVEIVNRGRGRGRFGNRNHGRGRGYSSNSSTGHSRSGRQSLSTNNSTIVNGVDISNPFRTFTSEEMDKLGPAGRSIMFQQRDRLNNTRSHGGRARGRAGRGRGRSINSVEVREQEDVSQITGQQNYNNTGTVAPTETEQQDRSTGGRGGRSGHRFGRGRHANAVRLVGRTSQHPKPVKIKAASMRDVTNMPLVADGHPSRNEIDSAADTCCAGKNWTPIYFTGDTVDVLPFSPEHYDSVKQIPVATCATMITTQSGREWLVVGHEMLYFGSKMERSLLNPNQMRMHGIQLDDDPTKDQFGITTPELFIPLETKGTSVFWQSRAPTFEEIDNMDIPHLVITADEPWDPQTVQLRTTPRNLPWDHSFHPEKRYEIRNIRKLTTGHGPLRAFETTHIQSDSDRTLQTVDGSFVEKTFIQRIIQSVRVEPETRHQEQSADNLARTLNIGLETAHRTMEMTTQQGIRTAIHPIHRRYRVDHLHLHRRRLPGLWYTDTLFSKVKSLQGNTCAQVLTNGDYVRVKPLVSKAQCSSILLDMDADIGIPESIISDQAAETTGNNTDWMKHVRRMGIKMRWAEAGRKNHNTHAEREIGELKKRWKRRMIEKHVPRRLWDYGLVYEAEILSRISRGPGRRPGLEQITGKTIDISEYTDFTFYDLVWYYTGVRKLDTTEDPRALGRWLGVSHRVGSDMSYWILTKSGKVISNPTVQHVTSTEKESMVKEIEEFNEKVNDRLNDKNHSTGELAGTFYLDDEEDEDPVMAERRRVLTPTDAEYGDLTGSPCFEPDTIANDSDGDAAIDKYIGAQLRLELAGEAKEGKVIARATDSSGNKVGKPHSNPLFDSREFIVKFEDESQHRFRANQIAEAIYSQVDQEGRQFLILDEIVDHRKDGNAIPQENGFWISKNGNRVPKKTTKGWKLCVQWKDGSTDWISLAELKDSNPIELAEYAAANNLLHEPAFNWWARATLKLRERIIAKVKSRYWKTTHKYGVRLPHSVDEALNIDRETGTTYWQDAIIKERVKVCVAWKARNDVTPDDVRQGKAKDMIGYQEITCHMVFDVKPDFTRKARFVANGATTETPSSVTYSSVASRDSIRLMFMIAALNDLKIFACDIGNAYLNAPCKEKIWFVGGSEMGEDKGKVMIVVRALYGLRSSGFAWHQMMSQTLREHGFEPTIADPDVWRKSTTKQDGTPIYEYIVVYVDDILAISPKAKQVCEKIGEVYRLKEGIEEPTRYLGAQIEKVDLPNGKQCWGIKADQYVEDSINTLQRLLDEDGRGQKISERKTPLPTAYKPELDLTEELTEDLASRYRQLIGILRWAVELGRVDILYEVSVMSQYQANPRIGHLEGLYHIFGHLKKRQKQKIVFDPTAVEVDESCFHHGADWTEFYGEVAEELPPGMPEPKGNSVTITCFVDSNHAGNVITRRSHTGILIFVQNAPIIFYSKRQNTVETSTFGSEFVAMRIAKEQVVALRYKLRMFGVPIDGPANVLCDNQGVVKNTSIPASTLNKKHVSIAYHTVREAVAAGILRVGKEDTETNLADLFTKMLSQARRNDLLANIVYGPYIRDEWMESLQKRKQDRKRKRENTGDKSI